MTQLSRQPVKKHKAIERQIFQLTPMHYSHSCLLYVMITNILLSVSLIFLYSRLLKGVKSIDIQVKSHLLLTQLPRRTKKLCKIKSKIFKYFNAILKYGLGKLIKIKTLRQPFLHIMTLT